MSIDPAPTVHLNGTSGDDLLRGYKLAHNALQEALQAVMATAPHPRDYYVQAPSCAAWKDANAAHNVRVRMLLGLIEDVGRLSLAVWQQVEDRRRR